VRVRYNFAGAPELVTQTQQGAPADVFASADDVTMAKLAKVDLVTTPRIFAHNKLVIIVPVSGSPVRALRDLAAPGVKLDVADQAVPVGNYTRQILENLSGSADYGPDFATRVLQRVVSYEDNVKAVVTKVSLGEADAGVCYATDVTPAVQTKVRVIEVPDRFNVLASYPIASTTGAAHGEQAAAYVQFVLGPQGQTALRDHHFLPAADPPTAAQAGWRASARDSSDPIAALTMVGMAKG
jgi:molybdate transport system substrate-binding protein